MYLIYFSAGLGSIGALLWAIGVAVGSQQEIGAGLRACGYLYLIGAVLLALVAGVIA